MQNMQDVQREATRVANIWFGQQCRDPFTDYYWWYKESTAERGGELAISPECPSEGFKLARPERLGKSLTVEQNVWRFMDLAQKLPILDPQLE